MKFKNWIVLFVVFFSFFAIGEVDALSYGRVTHTDGIFFRSGPGTNYSVIAKLKYNDKVLFKSNLPVDTRGCASGWKKVEFGKKTGYVCGKYISFSNTTVRVSKNNTFLRNGIGNNYKAYKSVPIGTILTLDSNTSFKGKGCSKGWYAVVINGSKKYICANNTDSFNSNNNLVVSSRGGGILKNNPNSKNVYKTIDYSQGLTMYNNNKKHKGIGCKEGYYKVNYNGSVKYICSKFVTRTKFTGFTTSSTSLKIKTSPSSYANTLTSVPYASSVFLYNLKTYKGDNCSLGYYKVRVNNRNGYVCSDYMSMSSYTTFVTSNSADVFINPDNNSNIIATLSNNSYVVLSSKSRYKGDGCYSGYFRVNVGNRHGYVCSDLTSYGKFLLRDDEKPATKIPVLTFHRIVSDSYKRQVLSKDEWTASATVFEEQLKYLYNNNYKTISLDELYCWYIGNCSFTKKTVALTFDDGNAEDYYLVLPILKKYDFKATSFIVGSRAEKTYTYDGSHSRKTYLTDELISTIKTEYPNFDLQSHSYDFHRRDNKGNAIVLSMSSNQIQNDFDNNRRFGFKYIAYPYGSYNNKMLEKTKSNGYLLGFRFKNQDYVTRKSPRYEMPRIKINGFSNVSTLVKWLDY